MLKRKINEQFEFFEYNAQQILRIYNFFMVSDLIRFLNTFVYYFLRKPCKLKELFCVFGLIKSLVKNFADMHH